MTQTRSRSSKSGIIWYIGKPGKKEKLESKIKIEVNSALKRWKERSELDEKEPKTLLLPSDLSHLLDKLNINNLEIRVDNSVTPMHFIIME